MEQWQRLDAMRRRHESNIDIDARRKGREIEGKETILEFDRFFQDWFAEKSVVIASVAAVISYAEGEIDLDE